MAKKKANGKAKVRPESFSKVEKNRNVGRKKGGTKTGGRKKGTPNKKNSEKIAALEAGGVMPLDYMLGVMRNPKAGELRQDEMSRAAAPYCHPKLSAIEHTGKDGKDLIPPVINIIGVRSK